MAVKKKKVIKTRKAVHTKALKAKVKAKAVAETKKAIQVIKDLEKETAIDDTDYDYDDVDEELYPETGAL